MYMQIHHQEVKTFELRIIKSRAKTVRRSNDHSAIPVNLAMAPLIEKKKL